MGPDGADEEQHQSDRGGDAERGYADADQQSKRASDLEDRERDERPACTPTLVMFSISQAGRRRSRVAAVPLAAAVRMPTATYALDIRISV